MATTRRMVHTGFIIENLLVVFEAFNDLAKTLSRKPLDIRNLIAVAHVSKVGEKDVVLIHDSLPTNTHGKITAYCLVKAEGHQGAFLGVCIEFLGKRRFMVLFDNGKNSLYACREKMRMDEKVPGFFAKLESPVPVTLRRYAQYE